MNPIKAQIASELKGDSPLESGLMLECYLRINELLEIGIDCDADAILYAKKEGEGVAVVGLVGRSLLSGDELGDYLKHYFADSGGLDHNAKRIASYLYSDMAGRKDGYMMLRSSDLQWRSFKPVLTVDEVRSRFLNQTPN